MVRSAWHRTLLALLGVCAVALVGTLHQGVAAAPARSASVPECRNADLHADYRPRDAAAGHRYGVVRLRNTSDRSCVVQGYGGLSYVGGGDGTQVGAAADREVRPVRRVVLAPGDRARSTVAETSAASYPRSVCRPTPVDGFRVYAPDATRSQLVVHPTTGCRNAAVHLLSHTPYRALR
ncbi:hypothetical protein ASG76_08790 [Nocardioides sp. Soil774]|uniref:DUF4232 domain-containing protein n=1 Tax=Nocardioides sp. Soil774 TaxID=1736408 RepID=UPI0006F51063|nr:DUF4232 domain-containing protein [Nocardioides sp. Soil774]KRE95700.1 hypothetical protein ASG76_08790 [Nocardioides sp. Soil774]